MINSWVQLRIVCDRERCGAVEDLLTELGASAVTLEDRSDQPIYEPALGETPLWDSVRITGLFAAETDTERLARQLQARLTPTPAWRFELLEERDWVREWMRDYRPMRFGERLWICPSWHAPPVPDAVNLALDPGLAFGTGTHPTTALCLRWLDGADLAGRRVLDYGCGSGILAIAALLLGAADAVGVDTDPQALTASRANASANGIDERRLALYRPDALPARHRADIVLANILAGPLTTLAPTLAAHTRPSGLLALSGILEQQAPALIERYRHWFAPDGQRVDQGWSLLTLRRNGPGR